MQRCTVREGSRCAISCQQSCHTRGPISVPQHVPVLTPARFWAPVQQGANRFAEHTLLGLGGCPKHNDGEGALTRGEEAPHEECDGHR
jgi:hypothetical protein